MAEWTRSAMSARSTTRRLRADDSRKDPDRNSAAWYHAVLNMHAALCSLYTGSPETAAFSEHAAQLMTHVRNITDAHFEDFQWSRLMEYDRAVRQLKAEQPAFDMGDERATSRTFQSLVVNPRNTATGPSAAPDRLSPDPPSPTSAPYQRRLRLTRLPGLQQRARVLPAVLPSRSRVHPLLRRALGRTVYGGSKRRVMARFPQLAVLPSPRTG